MVVLISLLPAASAAELASSPVGSSREPEVSVSLLVVALEQTMAVTVAECTVVVAMVVVVVVLDYRPTDDPHFD